MLTENGDGVSGRIGNGQAVTADFVNQSGKLIVRKSLNGNQADPNREFPFTVGGIVVTFIKTKKENPPEEPENPLPTPGRPGGGGGNPGGGFALVFSGCFSRACSSEGSFCILGICIFPEFAVSYQMNLVK